MRKLLNTLFVTSEDLYLSLENDNILAWREDQVLQRIPLINLENIFYFGYKGASPALLGACVKKFLLSHPTRKIPGSRRRNDRRKYSASKRTVSHI